MNRGYSREAYIELVHKIRQMMPDITFTSDFIAGFCGETEEEFEETLSLMRIVKYHNAFMFAYSMREVMYKIMFNIKNQLKLKADG